MSNTTRTSESPFHQRIRYHVWIGLGGTTLIGLSLVLPWTELIGRRPAGFDLISANAQLIRGLDEFEQARAARIGIRQARFDDPNSGRQTRARLGKRRGLGVRARIGNRVENACERAEVRRKQVDESLAMVKSILKYTQASFALLLAAGCLPLVQLAVSNRRGSAMFALLAAVLGGVAAATLATAGHYLAGLELLGESIPLLAGFWSAQLGAITLAIAGIWGLVRRSAVLINVQASVH